MSTPKNNIFKIYKKEFSAQGALAGFVGGANNSTTRYLQKSDLYLAYTSDKK